MRRSSPKKADRRELVAPVCAGMVLFSATILLCDVSGVKPGEQWPWWVDRILAIPVQLTDLTDLRAYALPMGLAVLLGIVALKRNGPSPGMVRHGGAWWFEVLGLATVAWACLSAWRNGTWELSRGWVFGLTCGIGWAILLGRFCNVRDVFRVLIAGSMVAAAAGLLSLAHRQGLGERFFQLPVGPITLTASLGALWTAVATVWLASALAQRRELSLVSIARREEKTSKSPRKRHNDVMPPASTAPSAKSILWTIAVGVVSLLLLLAANRRGAWMGLLAAWALVGGIVLWERWRSRGRRSLLVIAALIALTGAGWYVRGQARSTDAAVSVPLKVRSIYWGKMAEMIPQSPIWGFGPDQFVVKMTTALSRQRAEEPRVLHGTVDYDGHNEWLQATFELGIPGVLLYLSLPVAAAIGGWRQWRRSEGVRRVLLLALVAGLIEVCISEVSSVNLRFPFVQAWYWTLLGLTIAMSRADGSNGETRESPSVGFAARGACLLTAIFIVAIVAIDLRAAMHHAQGRALLNNKDAQATRELELATGRFGAARWLSSHTYLAASFSNQLRPIYSVATSQPSSDSSTTMKSVAADLGRRAIDAWSDVFRVCPGYLDTGFRLAEAQMMAGDIAASRRTLETFLNDLNPYDRQGNILQIQIGGLDPTGRLECIRRALRNDQMETVFVTTANECLASADVASKWPGRVAQALRDVAGPSESAWQDSLAPETLRIEAFRLIGLGDYAGAERVQFAAAQAYEKLASRSAPEQRRWTAEADTWFLSAQFLFGLNPTKYAEVFERICRAERCVIGSLLTEAVPNADPNAELVGGRLMPLELPETLSPLWHFSAMMHLVMKKDPNQINLRITWSLPADQRSSDRTFAELGRLSWELVRIFETQPESGRPPSYPRLVELARQFSPRS